METAKSGASAVATNGRKRIVSELADLRRRREHEGLELAAPLQEAAQRVEQALAALREAEKAHDTIYNKRREAIRSIEQAIAEKMDQLGKGADPRIHTALKLLHGAEYWPNSQRHGSNQDAGADWGTTINEARAQLESEKLEPAADASPAIVEALTRVISLAAEKEMDPLHELQDFVGSLAAP